ncbi:MULTISPECIES: fimbrial protein [unclassified Dyella]|uniref:fimbrial protein n=1 Tax=unclassified Dyella TaxID=2634549 RepID=UPI003F8FD439
MSHFFKKYLLILSTLVLAPLLPSPAHADVSCSRSPAYALTVTGGQTISIDNSAPIGQTVATITVQLPMGTGSCSGQGAGAYYYITGAPVPGYDSSYGQTGIPGLAYRWGGSNVAPLTLPYSSITGPNIAAGPTTIRLVKVGNITTGGTLSGEFGRLDLTHSNGARYQFFVSYLWNASFVVKVVNPTCSVSTKSVNVPMGTVSNPHLPIGQTFNPVDFNLQLTCSGGNGTALTTAYMTLTDATVPSNRSSTLNLAAGSTATGVGIQVLRNGTAVSFGPDSATIGNQNQFNAGSSANGTLTVPFTARYITTSNTVTPGLVKGLATFTVGYQ